MVPPFSLIKKTNLTRLVWHAHIYIFCIYIYIYIYIHAQVFTRAKISTCVTKLLILILQITDVIFQIQVAGFN